MITGQALLPLLVLDPHLSRRLSGAGGHATRGISDGLTTLSPLLKKSYCLLLLFLGMSILIHMRTFFSATFVMPSIVRRCRRRRHLVKSISRRRLLLSCVPTHMPCVSITRLRSVLHAHLCGLRLVSGLAVCGDADGLPSLDSHRAFLLSVSRLLVSLAVALLPSLGLMLTWIGCGMLMSFPQPVIAASPVLAWRPLMLLHGNCAPALHPSILAWLTLMASLHRLMRRSDRLFGRIFRTYCAAAKLRSLR